MPTIRVACVVRTEICALFALRYHSEVEVPPVYVNQATSVPLYMWFDHFRWIFGVLHELEAHTCDSVSPVVGYSSLARSVTEGAEAHEAAGRRWTPYGIPPTEIEDPLWTISNPLSADRSSPVISPVDSRVRSTSPVALISIAALIAPAASLLMPKT